MRARLLTVLAGFLWMGVAGFSIAQEAATEFTLDLPYDGHSSVPSWLGHPTTPQGAFATLKLPITPPDAVSAMLVTVFFEEKSGGFLRIAWQGPTAPAEATSGLPGPGEAAQSVMLSNNFYEGIGMKNQRSLLVPADLMKKPGGLVFTAGDTTLGISRIKIEWLQNTNGLSSPVINDLTVTSSDRMTKFTSELTGLPASARDASWQDHVVDVPLTDTPIRIEQGVDFPVRMENLPKRARLELKEAGLPFGQHLVVWLNDQRLTTLTPSAPALHDAGYSLDTDAYIGWRDGTILVPVTKLVAGDNTFEFSSESDDFSPTTNATPTPLALKDVTLQLDYPPASPPAPAPGAPSAAGEMDRLNPNTAPGSALLKLPGLSTATTLTSTTP